MLKKSRQNPLLQTTSKEEQKNRRFFCMAKNSKRSKTSLQQGEFCSRLFLLLGRRKVPGYLIFCFN